MTTGLFGEVPVRTPLPTGFLFFILTSVALAIFLRTWRKSKIAAKASSLPARLDFKETGSALAHELHLLGLWPDLQICARLCAHHECKLSSWPPACLPPVGLAAWQWSRSPWNAANLLLFLAISVVVIGAMLNASGRPRSYRHAGYCSVVCVLLAGCQIQRPTPGLHSCIFPRTDCFRPHDLVHRGKKRVGTREPVTLCRRSHQSKRVTFRSRLSHCSPGKILPPIQCGSLKTWGTDPSDYAHSVRYHCCSTQFHGRTFRRRPDGLGHTMVKDAGIPKKPKNFTVGPGFLSYLERLAIPVHLHLPVAGRDLGEVLRHHSDPRTPTVHCPPCWPASPWSRESWS